jgi:transcriptional regulator with XRE-family HTH domain
MDPLKEEFVRLVAIMGWSQSEAARQLHMSAAAVSNLVNPNHSNRPRPTTLQLLKLIVSGEHPEAIEPRHFKLKGKPGTGTSLAVRQDYLDARERKLITDIRRLSDNEQETIYRVVYAMIFRALPRGSSSSKRGRPKG